MMFLVLILIFFVIVVGVVVVEVDEEVDVVFCVCWMINWVLLFGFFMCDIRMLLVVVLMMIGLFLVCLDVNMIFIFLFFLCVVVVNGFRVMLFGMVWFKFWWIIFIVFGVIVLVVGVLGIFLLIDGLNDIDICFGFNDVGKLLRILSLVVVLFIRCMGEFDIFEFVFIILFWNCLRLFDCDVLDVMLLGFFFSMLIVVCFNLFRIIFIRFWLIDVRVVFCWIILLILMLVVGLGIGVFCFWFVLWIFFVLFFIKMFGVLKLFFFWWIMICGIFGLLLVLVLLLICCFLIVGLSCLIIVGVFSIKFGLGIIEVGFWMDLILFKILLVNIICGIVVLLFWIKGCWMLIGFIIDCLFVIGFCIIWMFCGVVFISIGCWSMIRGWFCIWFIFIIGICRFCGRLLIGNWFKLMGIGWIFIRYGWLGKDWNCWIGWVCIGWVFWWGGVWIIIWGFVWFFLFIVGFRIIGGWNMGLFWICGICVICWLGKWLLFVICCMIGCWVIGCWWMNCWGEFIVFGGWIWRGGVVIWLGGCVIIGFVVCCGIGMLLFLIVCLLVCVGWSGVFMCWLWLCLLIFFWMWLIGLLKVGSGFKLFIFMWMIGKSGGFFVWWLLLDDVCDFWKEREKVVLFL